MSYTFLDLQTEVKARSILNESGTQFDTQVKNAINTSLFRLSREANWRMLRRKATFDTVATYTTGSDAVTATNASKDITVTGATFITDGIKPGRLIQIGGSSLSYFIETVTGETTLTLDTKYDGDTSTTQTYKIFGQEQYNLPIQASKFAVVWHQDFGYPFAMNYIQDPDFYFFNDTLKDSNTPVLYRQWTVNGVLDQPLEGSVMRVTSSATADTSITITVFGTVSGYPDFEEISTDSSDGTTAVSGSKSFTEVDRVTKSATSTGRITVDANTTNTTIAVLPVGDTAGMIQYHKIQLFPYPTRVFPIHVAYYKDLYRLVGDNDMHELGYDFDEAIIDLSTAKLNFSQSKKDGDNFFALYKDELRTLRSKYNDTIMDWFPSLRKRKNSRNSSRGNSVNNILSYNQLGGQYGPMVNI